MKRFVIISLSTMVVLLAGYGTITLLVQGVNGEIDQHEQSVEDAEKAFEKELNKSQQITANDWLKAVNTVRTAHNAPKMHLDSRLNASAIEHAKDLQRYGWDSTPHYTQQRGLQGYDYIFKHFPNCYGGENIVWDYDSPKDGVEWWLSSKSHREAMLNPIFTKAGFGTNGNYTVFHMCQ